jgi:hypothetical protein
MAFFEKGFKKSHVRQQSSYYRRHRLADALGSFRLPFRQNYTSRRGKVQSGSGASRAGAHHKYLRLKHVIS